MKTAQLEDFFSESWDATIVNRKGSRAWEPDDLTQVSQIQSWDNALESFFEGPSHSPLSSQIAFFWPAMGHSRIFEQLFESHLGPELNAGFIWGATVPPLKLSTEDIETLDVIPLMMMKFAYKAKAFNSFCKAMPSVTNPLKDAYFDMQLVLINFLQEATRIIRSGEDKSRIRRFGSLGKGRESTADIQIFCSIQHIADRLDDRLSHFFDRVDVFEKLDHLLGPVTATSFRSVALYGLGGVGKSPIDKTYTERRFDEGIYDAVFWMRGQKATVMRQSFTDIALKLELPGAQQQNHEENLLLVQDWFQKTDCRWLVVYDNVESADLLRETGSDFLMFLLHHTSRENMEDESRSALIISKKLDGHPLAISHMAGLIFRRAYSVQDFANLYLKNPRGAHKNELTALFNFSFQGLDQDSRCLLGIMSFLMPDAIPADIFTAVGDRELPEDLDFCSDEFSFSEVTENLLTLALVSRDRQTRVFSIHRIVQTQFKFFLSLEQRQKSFDEATSMLYDLFPKENESSGQLYDAWQACNEYLPHALYLKDCFLEEKKTSRAFKATWKFCNLLGNCQKYLSEACLFEELESFCDANLLALTTLEDGPDKINLTATIFSHKANMADAIGDPKRAIDLNRQAYELRLKEKPRKENLLAFFENNLGFNCGSANDHERSREWYYKSRDRWLAMLESQGKEKVWPAFMKANTARSIVYLNDLESARALISEAIQELKSQKPLNWAWLANAYFVRGTLGRRQGQFEAAEASFMQAQNCWLKGDQTRLHTFNGGCMFNMAVCCLDQGKTEAAIKHLRDSMEVTRFHCKRLPVEHARNLYKLSQALVHDSKSVDDEEMAEAERLRLEAEDLLRQKYPGQEASDTDFAYDQHVVIFYR